MTWLSQFSPVPGFPPYSGPYKTGSIDIGIPTDGLESPSPSPDPSISTVSFRIFYPCESSSPDRPVSWLPHPHQRAYLRSYASFLGANNLFAQLFAYFPHLLSYTTIPVRNNARPLQPNTKLQKWPVMIFSHGLGGFRNSYSDLCGSLAAQGIVVVAPEHRDGSAPVTFIKSPGSGKSKPLYYRPASHKPSPEVYEHRDNQLKIRLWELGLIHDAILKTDAGSLVVPTDTTTSKKEAGELNEVLQSFRGQLNAHTPGSIALTGHSFGAATMVQFVKSVYYNQQSDDSSYQALYTPATGTSITKQITPSTFVGLLDMWCLPLRSPATKWLWERPMPCYSPSGPGGNALIAILSEAFFKWRNNLADSKSALSEDPTGANTVRSKPAPTFFYPVASAHLSQSDFGVLFPRLTKLAFKSEEPERCIKLNVRAILQKMRENGFEVASTSQIDMEEDEKNLPSVEVPAAPSGATGDWRIVSSNGGIRGWIPINLDDSEESESDTSSTESKMKTPADAVVEGEVLGEVREQRA